MQTIPLPPYPFPYTVTSVAHAPSSSCTAPHLFWTCVARADGDVPDITVSALIDNGSHTVLIHSDLAARLNLCLRKLHEPLCINLALNNEPDKTVWLSEYVRLRLRDPSNFWTAKTVRTVVAPGLCSQILVGLPFLEQNHIVIDHHKRTVIDKNSGFDLLNPQAPAATQAPKPNLEDEIKHSVLDHKETMKLSTRCQEPADTSGIEFNHIVCAIRQRVETLAAEQKLRLLSDEIKQKNEDVFAPIPHIDRLPTEVYCRIKLKDASKTIMAQTYSTPTKIQRSLADTD